MSGRGAGFEPGSLHSIGRPTTGEERKRQLSLPFLGAGRTLGSGGRRLGGGLLGVLLAEFLHAAGGVHDLLLAGVERVAIRADFHVQGLAQRGAGLEGIPATAGDGNFLVFWVDLGLHFRVLSGGSGICASKGGGLSLSNRFLATLHEGPGRSFKGLGNPDPELVMDGAVFRCHRAVHTPPSRSGARLNRARARHLAALPSPAAPPRKSPLPTPGS